MIKYTEFKQTRVRYSDKGKGRAIVLIHGFLGSLEIWEEFSERLSKKFRVIAIDLPGHGETPCIGYVHKMELIAQCVKAVMNHLQLRRYLLVGHSMGGYAALAFADLFPENVSGLCLFHSTALPDSAEKKTGRDRAIEAVKKNHRQFTYEFINKLFAPENIGRLENEIKYLQSLASKMTKQGIVNALEGMKERPNREHILKKSDYPILFIAGKKDSRIAWEEIIPQIKLCKYGSTLMLEEAGHMGFYEEKERTLNAILRFAKKIFRGEIKKNLA